MKKKVRIPINRILLPIFILGLFTLVFLKLIENRSIDKLVEKNIHLLAELDLHNKLHGIEVESKRVDNELRILVASKEMRPADEDILQQVGAIGAALDTLNLYSPGPDASLASDLIRLFIAKTDFQKQIIQANNQSAKAEAEKLLNSPSNRLLKDSIGMVALLFNQDHKLASTVITASIRESGREIHFRSIILVITAFIVCLLVCYFLLAKKKQSENSEKRVKAAASVKENFLANMSHEIRTPLNAILGFTHILQKSNLDAEQQKHIQVIHSSGNNLLSIVNEILDLSKIEAGMMRIEQTPFRPAEVMANVEEMLRQKADEKKLRLIVNVDSEIPDTVSGDAVRLTQVLINLISNAIKFTEDGGVYVRVTPYKRDGETISLEFLVRDTGIGIPKEKQQHIFERFEQAEAATTRRFGGTGLGLSIVKHLIDLQKGTITLNSEQGYGTSFLVVLPYKLTNEVASSVHVDKLPDAVPVANNKVTILVAEDNTLNQHLMRHLLKNWGFEFDIVGNGVLAVEAVRQKPYNMVLMDIQMPEMDGHAATRFIRNDLGSSIPIIAMTAHAMSGEREKCIANGMNDYISKPIDEKKLYQLITQYSTTMNLPATTVIQHQAFNQQVPAGPAKVINLQYVDEIAGGDASFKKDIIREFVNQVPAKINTLEKAIAANNFSSIRGIAHEMKTTVHFLGLSVLIGQSLQKIEDMASAQQSIGVIQQMFECIKSVCLQAVREAEPLVA
jgi:CheY-like chemotaxis protein/nitrogen-specific signal transduction histidine kinase/HPt (histidine-containing phosphotransfer) domain-containing protein